MRSPKLSGYYTLNFVTCIERTMEAKLLIEILTSLLGGLVIFLLGMRNMSEGMQAVAGERLRRLIKAVTDNRFIACGVGTVVTCLVQSSSITTVMVVGLVNAGFMTLTQSIGVILGADIGTTITAWIVALDILGMGLPMIGLSGLFFLFSKNEHIRYTAMMVLGLGMIFFGLLLMKNGVRPLRTMPEFQAWFSRFQPDDIIGILKCVFIGMLATAIVQSSSATVGITMVLASEGVIGYETAVALVIGENIGTTITAFLACLGASKVAKRAAYAHILIKIIGALWIIPMLPLFISGVQSVLGIYPGTKIMVDGQPTFPHVMTGIAYFHTAFNLFNVALCIPFVTYIAKMLERIVPDEAGKEMRHLSYVDIRLLEAPAIGLQQSQNEIERMGTKIENMLSGINEMWDKDELDEKKSQELFQTEEDMDVMQADIVEFLSKLLSGSVSHDVMEKGRIQLRMADEYESVSDYVVKLLKLRIKMKKLNINLSKVGQNEIQDLHKQSMDYVKLVNKAVKDNNADFSSKARTIADTINHTAKDYRDKHLEHFATEQTSSIAGLIFTDLLSSYRRIRSHTLNIAQALAGEK